MVVGDMLISLETGCGVLDGGGGSGGWEDNPMMSGGGPAALRRHLSAYREARSLSGGACSDPV